MTSKDNKSNYLIPDSVESDIEPYISNGIMKVQTPSLKISELKNNDNTPVYQLWCHSPRVMNNKLCLCNHSLGAVLGEINGHAIFPMLLECPKCRTAYAVTVELGGEEPVKILNSRVVNLNRAILPFVDVSLDAEKDTWIKIHEKNN